MTSKEPFEAVVVRHGTTVLRMCRAVVGAQHADDAWSETFLAAMRAYPGLRADANVQAWLVTIARHKCIDAVRAEHRRAVPTADFEDTATTDSQSDHVDESLFEALATLPKKQREVVVLHYILAMAYREVAAVLGGSEQAARRAAADGIAKLRTAYTPTRWKGKTK